MKIEKPCTENFSTMEKNSLGRHCSLCNKTVVDFTKMNTVEIQNYFSSATGEVCGRFKNFQLDQKNGFEKMIYNLQEYLYGLKAKPMRIAFLALLSGIMTFANSCMGKAIYKEDIMKSNPKQNSDSLRIKQMNSEKR
jgi:hypothetical protein